MVIVLWGILGVVRCFCALFVGLVLCALSVTYVFMLKKQQAGALRYRFLRIRFVEAGVVRFVFGPRGRRPVNPSLKALVPTPRFFQAPARLRRAERQAASFCSRVRGGSKGKPAQAESVQVNEPAKSTGARKKHGRTDGCAQRLRAVQEQLSSTEEMLEEALAGARGLSHGNRTSRPASSART